jgi:uncharacterized short protein YbdD (DUF466 family)
VLLRNVVLPWLSCREVRGTTIEQCLTCARDIATQVGQGWRGVIGAPDYKSYLTHHAAYHSGATPLSERDYVKMYIERHYNRRGAGRCC